MPLIHTNQVVGRVVLDYVQSDQAEGGRNVWSVQYRNRPGGQWHRESSFTTFEEAERQLNNLSYRRENKRIIAIWVTWEEVA